MARIMLLFCVGGGGAKLLFMMLFCIMKGVICGVIMDGCCGTCAGLLGLDLSWLMEGAGPALGERGASRLSTSMLIAPVVSAQVAPSLVDGLTLVVVGCCCWLLGAIGCRRPTGVGCIPVWIWMI